MQVHPPAEVATQLGGEPKTEMWYVMDAMLDSDLYAGMKRGATRESFKEALHLGLVAEQINVMPVKKGDTIFIPSGRVHAIGAGNLIVEVQQNSDTTYRVFDWNRIGSDGRPRDLHIAESLASINFDDIEPSFATPVEGGPLVECEYFRVDKWQFTGSRSCDAGERFAIFTVVDGQIACGEREFGPGSFFLVPPVIAHGELKAQGEATVLKTTIPAA